MNTGTNAGARLSLLQLRAIAAIHSGRVEVSPDGTVYLLRGWATRAHLAVDRNGCVDPVLVLTWIQYTTARWAGRPLVQKDDGEP